MHRRTGEQVSGTARSCDPAPGEGEVGFWEAPSATARLLRHGSSSVLVRSCGVPSSTMPVAVLRSEDRLCLICVVRLLGGSRSVHISRSDPVHNHVFEIMFMMLVLSSMLESCMLDLILAILNLV